MSENPRRDDELASVLVHGLRPVFVQLHEYDPQWIDRYDRCAAALRQALGDRIRQIEHIGSTSVPGLAAKPVVDIVIGVADPDDEAAYLTDVEALGYDLRVREPGHRALRGGEPDEPVNLHCYPAGHAEIRRYLVFRDRLRTDTDDRERYASVKRGLAGREWGDMNHYADAKSPVIAEILARAGWVPDGSR